MTFGLPHEFIYDGENAKVECQNVIKEHILKEEEERAKYGDAIIHPLSTDIILGRGRHQQEHEGNLALAQLASNYRDGYFHLRKHEKTSLIHRVVERLQNHGVRFLERQEPPPESALSPPESAAAAVADTVPSDVTSSTSTTPSTNNTTNNNSSSSSSPSIWWREANTETVHEKVSTVFRSQRNKTPSSQWVQVHTDPYEVWDNIIRENGLLSPMLEDSIKDPGPVSSSSSMMPFQPGKKPRIE